MQSRLRSRFLTLLLPLLLLSACGDSLVGPPPPGFGTFRGRWDGADWNGYGYAVVVSDSLFLIGRYDISAAAGITDQVRVAIPFAGVGSYQIKSSEGELAKITGGDTGFFPDATGQMQITNYDGVILSGTISLTAQGPDGVWRFENGTFDVPVFMSFAEVPPHPID